MNTPTTQNQQLLDELVDLFESVPPSKLRKNVEELYHSFLAEPTAVLPSKEVAVSMYFLIRFLNEMEDQLCSSIVDG